MKLTMERADLLRVMAQAQSVVERRHTIPILGNVLIEAEEAQTKFRATDLDIEVVDIAPAMVNRAGSTTVSATLLHDIVRKLPEGSQITLTLDSEKDRINVSAGRSSFSLATLPREDFPIMATTDYPANFSVKAAALRRLFDKTRFAVSTEETRYYLNGVYLHIVDGAEGKALRAVATDGHRLARVDMPMPAGAEDMPGVIVPRKAVGELRKLLEQDDQDVAVSVSETKIRLATPDVTFTTKTIEGTFPDYTRVIPANNQRELRVDAADFAKAVDRVATVSMEKSRAVKLALSEDRVVLSVTAPDSGNAEEELVAAYGDQEMAIGFNARYLLEISGQIERDNAVFMLNEPGDPALIREGDDQSAVYVVMPMRV